jgi:hypothetical protein
MVSDRVFSNLGAHIRAGAKTNNIFFFKLGKIDLTQWIPEKLVEMQLWKYEQIEVVAPKGKSWHINLEPQKLDLDWKC